MLADAVDLQRDVQQLSSAKQIDQVYKRMKTITPIHGIFCTSHTYTLDNPYARLINTRLIDLCLCLQMQLAQVEERLSRLRQMLDQGTQNSEDNVDRYKELNLKIVIRSRMTSRCESFKNCGSVAGEHNMLSKYVHVINIFYVHSYSAVPVSQVVKTQVRSLLETTQRGLLQIYNAQRAARLQTLLVQVRKSPCIVLWSADEN